MEVPVNVSARHAMTETWPAAMRRPKKTDVEDRLGALVVEIDCNDSVHLQFEASETLRDKTSKELEMSRVLVSFSGVLR